MVEKITLDMLTQNGVSVKKEYEKEIDGNVQNIGKPWRKAYVNSIRGRKEVEEELPEKYKSALFSVWGDTPTIEND